MRISFLLLAICFSQLLKAQNSIKIELRLKPNQLKDSGIITFLPVEYILQPQPIVELKKPYNGILSLTRDLDGAEYFNFSNLLRVKKRGFYLVEPGDQIQITSNGEGFDFSGKGFEKYQLQYFLDSLNRSIPEPSNHRDYSTMSVEDYFEWESYLHKKFSLGLRLINTYQGKISDYAFELIKDEFISSVINNLDTKFQSLRKYIITNNFNTHSLIEIFDTSYVGAINEWIQHASNKRGLTLSTRPSHIYREYSFDIDRMPTREEMNLRIYKEALKVYSGRRRESYIVNYFPEQIMMEVGFTPEVEDLLAQYYAEPSYPEWKKWMKEQERKIREGRISSRNAPNFSFTDLNGKVVTKENLKGKYAVLYFMKKGQSIKEFRQMEEKFMDGKNVIFFQIPSEKITNQKILKDYAVVNFPTVWIMHPDGYIINAKNPKIEWSKDKGKSITALLLKHLAYSKDGPYVLHEGSTIKSHTVNDKLVTTSVNPKLLTVQTDLDKSFQVMLKKSLSIEPSNHARPKDLIALSDIEGNFDAFRKLLQNNKIIDQNFNWIFGKGHLVFAGDMFDRGNQVTECLWLMYSLEEKAKAAGGYVHFVLGNHEIMNLQGDHRYVQQKYKDNATLMGRTLTQLYNEDSELGRWLRTKNIMERIGDLLFLHGGISHPMWRSTMTIEDVNRIARPYYANPMIDSTNENLKIIYGNKRVGPEKSYSSPFWFRGYYGDIDNPYEIPTMKQLDSTLQKFNVRRIITGHTIVADTISVHYGGKVINTDAKHAEGKSEALLIEGDKFYRVNAEGKRVLLFIDDRKKQTEKIKPKQQ